MNRTTKQCNTVASSKPGHTALAAELDRLKTILDTGRELVVDWLPNTTNTLCGEVKGNRICVYDEDIESALQTLRHEFLDYVVCRAIEPYKNVTNKLIELLNDEAYKRKERLVEALRTLLVS